MSEARKRRPRDPEATREAILEAAGTRLAADGPEGLSLSEVAHLAGVNRGTAYQHFETREKLIKATAEWVSDKLFRAVFGENKVADVSSNDGAASELAIKGADVSALTDRLSDFAMENPEICRVWLQQVLASPDPSQDPFWREYSGRFEQFAATSLAEPGIDVEVLSVVNLAGVFFWPILVRAHAADDRQRSALTQRYSREILRLSLYGTMHADAFPELADRVRDTSKAPA